jgi:hypothetical protein
MCGLRTRRGGHLASGDGMVRGRGPDSENLSWPGPICGARACLLVSFKVPQFSRRQGKDRGRDWPMFRHWAAGHPSGVDHNRKPWYRRRDDASREGNCWFSGRMRTTV